MNTQETRTLIYKAAEMVPKGTEFDAKIIEEILFENFDEIITSKTIGQLLGRMNFSQRKLSGEELQKWRSQHGTRPRTVYSVHLGQNSKNYERGIGTRKTRPLLSEIQERNKDTEECATCPEFNTCQGQIIPCPRYPIQVGAPRNKVMRLGEFNNE